MIHTDFEKGFICAEVMTFEDLKELGDEEAVKKAGKLRQQGKKYVVQDADVIFFKVRRRETLSCLVVILSSVDPVVFMHVLTDRLLVVVLG